MDSLVFSLNATVPIFAVIFISYFLRQRGFLTDGFVSGADKFAFRVLLPLLLFRDIAAGRFSEQFDLRFIAFCVVATCAMFAAIWIGAELFFKDKTQIGAFTQGAYRSSLAILGVAFAQSIYGRPGLVPLMIVTVVPLYNIFAVVLLTVRSNDLAKSGSRGFGMVRLCVRGILTNTLILGILLGLPFSLLQIEFPVPVAKTIDYFAMMASPLALVTIGASFEGRKAIQKIGPTLWASAIKLLLVPGIFLTAAVLMGFRNDALVAMLAMLASPSTVTCYIMCKNMGGDAVLSSSIVVVTTALSAVTMTVFIYLLRTMGVI